MNRNDECDESLPRVIVLPQAWHTITVELDRASREGILRSGSPDEAVFLPLCAIVHRPGQLRAPRLEQTRLADVAALIVADALIPSREMVDLSAMRIRFRPSQGSWEQTQALFDAQLDETLEKRPRLNLLARGHSHPFDVGRTHPSGPDRSEHLAPCLHFNRTLGLNAGFTFIAVRAREGEGWALHCFTTRDGNEVVDLGLADLPKENGAANLLEAPFYATDAGRALESAVQEALGAALRIERLPLGWTRYRMAPESGTPSVLALPPGFPAAPGRRFVNAEGTWSAQDVIDWRAYLPLERAQPAAQEVAP